VNYRVEGFLDKNRDTLFEDLKNLCLSSENSLLRSIFETQTQTTSVSAPNRKGMYKYIF
jgi:myosin heavy subunit